MPDVLEWIQRRRSIRQFTEQPVERASLEILLKAAMSAPTACNSQPWEFIVITEKEILDSLRSRLLFMRYNAPAAVVVCGNPEIANNSAGKTYWVQDCSAAMENLLLAAVGLGLGAVWIGVYPLPSVIKPVSDLLGIPEHVTPLGIALVGHPAEEKSPRTQYDRRRVYWEVYEPRKTRAKKKNAKKQE
jgi:nitroreductase